MPLAKMRDILAHATENHYGVAAVNVFNYETVKWVIQAAEQERTPVIVQVYPGFDSYIPLGYLSMMAKDLAAQSPVPVAVHLDHSVDYETAVNGMRAGFPSVMVDGSSVPYEENVGLTVSVVRTARVFGADVEAELGHVGSGARLEDMKDAGRYTDVDQARAFVEKTQCGSLAVAVGNAHGAYIQTPNLDFDRIAALRRAVPVPLVLHGCSDIPRDQLQESVRLGMSKFNIATEYFRACGQSVAGALKDREGMGLPDVMMEAAQGAVDFVREKMQLLNPNGFSL